MEHTASWPVMIAAIGVFVIGYAAITLEHVLKINKSGIALLTGSILWVMAAASTGDRDIISSALGHETQEIFSIVIFLLAAMAIVETLIHYGLFEWIRQKISSKEISAMKLFWLLGALTFVLSAILDNLTTTLLMIQVGRKIYRDKRNFFVFICATIIAANAGGAPSPLGDVTTIMLWLAGKFNAAEVLALGILPALACWIVPHYLLSRKILAHEEAEKEHTVLEEVKPKWRVIIPAFLSFTFPIAFSFLGLPPFLGLLAGLGIVWIITDIMHKKEDETHDGKILSLIQKTDVSTLKFFIGILLAVGALAEMGVLALASNALIGEGSATALIGASITLGGVSAILDNVPLVAVAMELFPDTTPTIIWILLALTAGTGGSMLVIGSAAGVAAMGQVKELNFVNYLKTATIPAAAGFVSGIIVWAGIYTTFY